MNIKLLLCEQDHLLTKTCDGDASAEAKFSQLKRDGEGSRVAAERPKVPSPAQRPLHLFDDSTLLAICALLCLIFCCFLKLIDLSRLSLADKSEDRSWSCQFDQGNVVPYESSWKTFYPGNGSNQPLLVFAVHPLR